MMDFINDVLRGLLGISVMLFICYAVSYNRKAIAWKTIIMGMILQVIIAVVVLKVPFANTFFSFLADAFQKVMGFSSKGAEFLFGSLVTDRTSFGYIFAFQVLPTIVFFSALSSILFYFGILQKVVFALAWVMARTMKISGPESLSSAANIFIGQTEAPLLIKPYLKKMTNSEIFCVMVGGMATIAGGVFAAYVGFLGGDDPVVRTYFAKHLLMASIMSAPAAIVCAKLIFPETEQEVNKEMYLAKDTSDNVLDAISSGTTDGLKLAINVGVMLLAFTALISLANELLMKGIGGWTGLNDYVVAQTNGKFEGFNFTFLLGVIFAPIAWLLGTPLEDSLTIGLLLGQKTVLNEFVAYSELNHLQSNNLIVHPKSILIATYALCGFANFASIGIQIGGIGALAPEKRVLLTQLGIRALIGGTIASFLTACIAGML